MASANRRFPAGEHLDRPVAGARSTGGREPALSGGRRARRARPRAAHEPRGALRRRPTGLEALERLCRRGAGAARRRGGGLALEIAPGQAAACQRWLRAAGLATARAPDLAGRVARVVAGRPGLSGHLLSRRPGKRDHHGSDRRFAGAEALRGEVDRVGARRTRRSPLMAGALARRRGETARSATCRACATSARCSRSCARSERVRAGPDRRARGAHRREHDHATPRRPTTWSRRCAPRSSCWGRCSRASAPRACPSPAAARSACARSIST